MIIATFARDTMRGRRGGHRQFGRRRDHRPSRRKATIRYDSPPFVGRIPASYAARTNHSFSHSSVTRAAPRNTARYNRTRPAPPRHSALQGRFPSDYPRLFTVKLSSLQIFPIRSASGAAHSATRRRARQSAPRAKARGRLVTLAIITPCSRGVCSAVCR